MADSGSDEVYGFQTVQAVAKTLDVPTVYVMRLLARQRLQSANLNGKLLLDPADLASYVKKGAMDLKPPAPIRNGWYSAGDMDRIIQIGSQLAGMADKIDATAIAANRAGADVPFGQKRELSVAQKANTNQVRLLSGLPGDPDTYANLAQEFLAANLRQITKRLILNAAGLVSDVAGTLFQSAAFYETATAAGLAKLQSLNCYGCTQTVFVDDAPCIVRATLSLTDVIGIAGDGIIDAAF